MKIKKVKVPKRLFENKQKADDFPDMSAYATMAEEEKIPELPIPSIHDEPKGSA